MLRWFIDVRGIHISNGAYTMVLPLNLPQLSKTCDPYRMIVGIANVIKHEFRKAIKTRRSCTRRKTCSAHRSHPTSRRLPGVPIHVMTAGIANHRYGVGVENWSAADCESWLGGGGVTAFVWTVKGTVH